MHADISLLYSFPGGMLYDFKCRSCRKNSSSREWTKKLTIVLTRKGNYLYKTFRKSLDIYNSFILIEKPGYEHQVYHDHQDKDECMFLELDGEFIQNASNFSGPIRNFLKDPDQTALSIPTNSRFDYLHWQMLQHTKQGAIKSIVVDQLITAVIYQIFHYCPGKSLEMADKIGLTSI